MEELKVMNTEVEELEPENEAEEVSENSSAGALFAGIVGGFLAYAAICGAKKLTAFIIEKRAARKTAEVVQAVTDTESNNGEDEADS